MTFRFWKVYGKEGHRQALSFGQSEHFIFLKDSTQPERNIIFYREDATGTNDYVIVGIGRDSAEDCERELDGQLSDGFFENHRYGEVIEITKEEVNDIVLPQSNDMVWVTSPEKMHYGEKAFVLEKKEENKDGQE